MANEEQIEILKQGVEVWNKWREDNPAIRPDLCKADLRKADLRGVNFSKADLSGTDLRYADLSGAFLYSLFDKKPKEIIKEKQESDLIRHDMFGTLLEEGGLFRYVRITDLREARLIETRLNGANLKMANLSGANLSLAMLVGANLENVDLQKAILHEARLNKADLSRANLNKAELRKADLLGTNLFDANLSDAKLPMVRLNGAKLFGTNLIGANLSGAILNQATFVKTQLQGTNLSNCHVYGISAWDLKTDKETKQLSLVITDYGEPAITVDNLEVAQFIYLLLNNEKIRHVIDTITSKVVLILGRFTEERKAVLDAIRDELHCRHP